MKNNLLITNEIKIVVVILFVHQNSTVMKNKIIQKVRTFLAVLLVICITNLQVSAQVFDINQTISDGAQQNTLAFDGLAFLTGNFCACSFIPPGKVADYFGFQYVRDNDITGMGHTTDFNTVIANNLMYVLDSNQKADMIALAKAQVANINLYGTKRFPIMSAFLKMRDLPGNTTMYKDTVLARSAELYRLDAIISMQRAQLYSKIIKALNAKQRHYLDSVKVLGMANMPVLPDQIDKRPLNNNQFVGVMSIAGDIYSWYVGNVASDVYFCPERQGNYFGSFYIKDAPAMGVHGYSIDTSLTQSGGSNFIAILDPAQKIKITSLVDSQRNDLYTIVSIRDSISRILRGYLTANTIDSAAIVSLSDWYGRLDGDISYRYARAFSEVGWSLTKYQQDTIKNLRHLDGYPCTGAYLYSDSIAIPTVDITPFFPPALPIGVLNFNGEELQNTIKLYWNTSVNQYKYFNIEKSKDGINWSTIATVNNNYSDSYSSIDINPVKGINYYRLQLFDMNGSYSYSKTIAINKTLKAGVGLSVLNYTHGSIRINILDNNFNATKAYLYNGTGQLVKEIVLQNSTAETISGLPTGVYYLRTEGGVEKVMVL